MMNSKINKTKLIARIMLLIILFSSIINLNSCVYMKDIFRRWIGAGSWEVNIFHCSYEIDKEKYDINCVTLVFYYGVGCGQDIDIALETSVNYPVFEIYFENDEGTSVLVKHVEENLISEKYGFTYGHNNKELYNHSEELTIPKELFTKERGMIWFHLYGTNIIENSGPQIIASTVIHYQKNGDTIMLSKNIQS